MKRALFATFAVLALLFSANMAFADGATAPEPSQKYTSQVQSIADALKPRPRAMKNNVGDLGPGTDIIVINYTNSVLHMAQPIDQDIDRRVSVRITNSGYSGQTLIDLGFWNGYVPHHSRVSIDAVNGNYTVDVKNDFQ